MRNRLLAIGLAITGLLSAAVAALAVWRRLGRDAANPPTEPIRPPRAADTTPMPLEAAEAPPAPSVPAQPPPRTLPADLEPHPTGIFAAVGRFDYRFRRILPVIGLLIVAGLFVWSRMEGGDLIQGGWVIDGSEEQQAEALLADRFGEPSTSMIVLFTDPAGDAASPAFQDKVAQTLDPIRSDPLVTGITTYADSPVDQLLSRDGSETLAIVTLNEELEASVDQAYDLGQRIEPPDGVEAQVTGIPQLYHEFNQRIEADLVKAEMISLPIALVILLAVFGTLVGAVLPLLIAAFALPAAFAVIGLLAGVTEMSIFVTNLASMIGLALAIDYSLFMVSRYREELRHHSVEIAIERMMGSVGKAVAVSGVAVAIGLSSLTVFEAAALRSMGVGGIITVVSTLIFALTVLPAILAMLGPRVNRLRIPLPGRLRLAEEDADAADVRQGHGIWGWIAGHVMRRPLLISVPVFALLLLAGSPFLGIQLSTGQNLEDLPATPARTAFLTITEDFPGNESDPIRIALTWEDATPGEDGLDAGQQSAMQSYVDELAALDGVTGVESVLDAPPGIPAEQYRQLLALPPSQRPAEAGAALDEYVSEWLAGDTAEIQVRSRLLPDSDAGRALVDAVRAVDTPDGTDALTAGLPSRSRDFMDSFYDSVPVAVLIVVAVTGGILFLTFGSVFLPVKAVLMSLVSVSASFGALVWIFQEGHLSAILGVEPSGTTAAWLPIIMFAILFGLSMDYEVLLLSRIRERYLAHGDNTRAVREGIGITGGIITGAALIMVAVFGAFSLSSIIFLKALGFSMALAVLVDATVVRGILVPAFMRLAGFVNWWAPRWIQRIVARLGLYEGPEVEAAPGARA
ncbi:MAG TPA: MMPL family transporter [Candidatus Limnocylindria bacterium]|nr:MMPL family transporter [Candidatus Limnocylindria bacterium]